MNDKAYVILAKFPGLNPEIQIWRGMIGDTKEEILSHWEQYLNSNDWIPENKPKIIKVQKIVPEL